MKDSRIIIWLLVLAIVGFTAHVMFSGDPAPTASDKAAVHTNDVIECLEKSNRELDGTTRGLLKSERAAADCEAKK